MSSNIRVTEHPNYRTINVTGTIANHGPSNIQLILFSEEVDGSEVLADPNLSMTKLKTRRTIECRLLMDPYSAKVIQSALNGHIQDYEKKFGKITIPNITTDDSKEKKNDNAPAVYT